MLRNLRNAKLISKHCPPARTETIPENMSWRIKCIGLFTRNEENDGLIILKVYNWKILNWKCWKILINGLSAVYFTMFSFKLQMLIGS